MTIRRIPTLVRWWKDLAEPVLGLIGVLQFRPVDDAQTFWYFIAIGSIVAMLGWRPGRKLAKLPAHYIIHHLDGLWRVDDLRFAARAVRNTGLGILFFAIGGWIAGTWQFFEIIGVIGFVTQGIATIIRRSFRKHDTLTIQGNQATSESHALTIEIPSSWEVRDVFGMRDPNAIVNMAPVGSSWPNIELTFIGRIESPSIETTRQFTRYLLEKRGWHLLEERITTVCNMPAYEFSYEYDGMRFCKLSMTRHEQEYLLQLAAENWPTDLLTFRHCAQTLRFH